jgi:hypothetical protein
MREPAKNPKASLAAAAFLFVALGSAVLLSSAPGPGPARTLKTLVWELRYRLVPVTKAAGLAEIHAEAHTRPREQCVSCHGDETGSKLLVHRIHLTSKQIPELACPECHRRVELGSRSATVAVEWVDVGFCKRCHSPFPGLNAGSPMHPGDFNADCLKCHTGERAVRHAQPYLSRAVSSEECRGCHGGRSLPWTTRHERRDWLQVHGAEALESGTRPCFACHDFGLKFCDACHAKKPPSHLPADRWRAIHSDAARADTRVCYTCHKTTWCKTCHVNHEPDWLTGHRAYVREHGRTSCKECHSLSACSYCHGTQPGSAADPGATP